MIINTDPYNWPYDSRMIPKRTALMIIDMQIDFCGKGGYVDRMGYDLSFTARVIEPIKHLLEKVRSVPRFTVIHTREGHRPDLSDLPANKRWRSKKVGAEIGSPGSVGRTLVRGEPGWQIIDELAPLSSEIVIDKPGKGSFYATDLDCILLTRGITHLILTGITTDFDNHLAALKMVVMQGGIFGCVSSSDKVIAVLEAWPAEHKENS